MTTGPFEAGRILLRSLPEGWAAAARRLFLALVVLGFAGPRAEAAEALPRQLDGVTVSEQLGAAVDLGLTFTDQDGRVVRLGDLVRGDVPVLLTLNYFSCATLCGVQLNALLEGLRGLEWAPGDHFRVVTVSIDPREQAALASAKRKGYLDALGKGEVDWSFLISADDQVSALARQVGFGYRFDQQTGQYAHPAVLVFLAPDGTVARYLYGIQYSPRDLKFALMEAAAGRVGSPVDKLVLSCFRYDEASGRYAPAAFGLMRLGGGLTVVILGAFVLTWWRRERRLAVSGAASVGAAAAGGK